MNARGKGSHDDKSSRLRKADDEFVEKKRLSAAQPRQADNKIAPLVEDTKQNHPCLSSSKSTRKYDTKKKNMNSDEPPWEDRLTSRVLLRRRAEEEGGSETTTIDKEPASGETVIEQDGGQKQELVHITTRDVLCGKTKEAYNHVGNKFFREIVSNSVTLWNSADSTFSKADCIQGIVKIILENGGRFLKQHYITKEWVELDSRQIRDKVGHAIRDAANVSMIKSGVGDQQRRNSASAEKTSSLNDSQSSTAIAAVASNSSSTTMGNNDTPPTISLNISSTPRISKKRKTGEKSFFSKKRDDTEKEDNNKSDRDSSEDDFLDYIDDALGPLQRQK